VQVFYKKFHIWMFTVQNVQVAESENLKLQKLCIFFSIFHEYFSECDRNSFASTGTGRNPTKTFQYIKPKVSFLIQQTKRSRIHSKNYNFLISETFCLNLISLLCAAYLQSEVKIPQRNCFGNIFHDNPLSKQIKFAKLYLTNFTSTHHWTKCLAKIVQNTYSIAQFSIFN
jgi:hypothetical protein